MSAWSPKNVFRKIRLLRRGCGDEGVKPNPDPSPTANGSTAADTTGLVIAGIHVTDRAKNVALWLFTVCCAAGAVLWLPSVASVALVAAALLACPLEVVRNKIALQVLRNTLRAPSGVSTSTMQAALAVALFVLGGICAPAKGQLSVASFLDLQTASAGVTGAVEYSRSPINIFDYVECDGEGVELHALDDVNASRVGSQQVTMELSESIFSKQEELEVQVQDTQAPQIVLATDHVKIELGDEYETTDNIVSVVDPVDGKLEGVEEVPASRGTDVGRERFYDEGWYHIQGDVDTSAAGTTVIQVRALDQHGNETTASFDVEVIDPLEGVTIEAKTSTLEYSNKQVKATQLISCSDPDTTVKAKNRINLQKVGKQTVTYKLSKGKSTREDQVVFQVRDTKNPTISLTSEEVVIDRGGTFDPYANVSRVSDEVDGELERKDARPSDNGNGWYTIEGSYDVNSASRYYLTVVACDRNGNEVTKEFSLKVNEPPAAATGFPTGYETGGPAAAGTNYVINTNTDKFHYPSCRDVKRIAAHNRWDVTMTRDEVMAKGYVPCKHCNP